jgi:two-component system, cell cycle sensor histidine kinase and response regulator CckA
MAAILVVEDERVVARDIQESLVHMGYDVIGTAASSAECLAHAEERRPDLVLMDIRIEGALDGIETARILRSRFGVPVIFLTAFADEQTVARAKETEAHGYILKPFRAGELRSAVEIALFKHEMETRLKLRERWFATTLRAIGDAVMAVDDEGRVNFANPVAEALLGSSAEELIGRGLREVFRPIDERTRIPITLPSPKDVAAGKSSPILEGAALVSPSGEHPIEDSLSPIIDDQGQLLGAVIVFRDVSEARRLRERVALSERMASLGTLAAGVAHEINNPLTYVLGNAAVVARELDRMRKAVSERREPAGELLDMVVEQSHTLSEALLEIQEGAERIRSIVVDLRAFSRPESAEQPGDVRSALDWALRVVEPELRARARLVTKLEPLPRVRGSGSHLGQVFLNLLLNAAQALAEGPGLDNVIEVTTSVDPDGFVVVDVRDSGVGMAPDIVKRIFEPFFTTKPVGKGTGLGLSICHGIVTAIGGEIEVLSSPGFGSRFRVRLPPDTSSDHPRPSAVAAGPEVHARILVIDDEPQVGTAIRRILSGHEVVSATSATQGFELIAEDPSFDLVLCDLAMAEVSGRDFYERLAADRPELTERVVFMSGGAFSPELEGFLKTTTRPCLPKPFGAAELRNRINLLLRAQRRTASSGRYGSS